jgi:hypothetical protein
MRAQRGTVAALLLAAVVAACTEVSTDPQVPVSLQFDSLPALAVVVGDTMRGGDLLPARVPAKAFNGAGDSVGDEQIRLIGIDTSSVRAFRAIDGLRLVGSVIAPTVRVVAQAGSLQSQTQTFAVVRAPTGLNRFAPDSLDSLVYNATDTARRFKDARIAVFAADTLLPGLRVRFRIVTFTPSILDSVRLIDSVSRRPILSALMTGQGAAVRVKAYPKSGAAGRGTVTLEASFKAFGLDVPGSPRQFDIRLVPRTP